MSVTFIGPSPRHPKGQFKVVVTHRNKLTRRLDKREKMVSVEKSKRDTQLKAQQVEINLKNQFNAAPRKKTYEHTLQVKTVGEALQVYARSKKMHGKNKGSNRDVTQGKQAAYFKKVQEHFQMVPVEDCVKAVNRFIRNLQQEKLQVHGCRLDDGDWEQKQTDQIRSNATINRHLSILRAAIRCCSAPSRNYLGEKLIKENYLADFVFLPEAKKMRHYLSPEERRDLLANLPEFARPITYFAMRIPCRVEELLTRRIEHFDQFRQSILLGSDIDKTGQGRRIRVADEFMPYLKNLNLSECDFLFRYHYERMRHGYRVGPIAYKTLNKAFVAARKTTGLPESFTFHSLRAQAAYDLLVEGTSTAVVMSLGGWESFTAFKRYVDLRQLAFDRQQYQEKKSIDESWKKELAPARAA